MNLSILCAVFRQQENAAPPHHKQRQAAGTSGACLCLCFPMVTVCRPCVVF